MNSARLSRIEEIYHLAADKDRGDWDELVRNECGDDDNLRQEVLSLLSYEEISDSFIDSSPDAIAAEMFSEEERAPLIGKTIGHYDIKRLIGVGGMGEVYLADDTLLGRKVAVKLVPPDLAQYRGHLNRFKQEAKSASALNHPNILTIHEFGAEDGANYIVSEFVDGVTLRQRLDRGDLSGGDTLDIAIQVASALAAAHELGIIHRDIKPENIMIRRDRLVKVLDFGLAKLTMPAASDSETGKEGQTLLKTAPGSVMGTAAYMSPEQTRGVKVDGRTDIWSLGVVIYEMVTGRRPFEGTTQTDVVVAILKQPTPALDELITDTPPELARIIDKALAKNIEERYQTVAELASDLRSLKSRLEFEEELQRSHKGRSSVKQIATETVTKTIPIVDRSESLEIEPASEPHKRYNRIFLYALILVLVVMAALITVVVWRSQTVGTSPTIAATNSTVGGDPAAEAPLRTLLYSLTVQSYTDGRYKEPFTLSGEMLFRNRDRVRLNIKGPQSGYLYILNQGPKDDRTGSSFNILFPTPMTNDGSALLATDQEIQIPERSWFQLDTKEGTELVWLIWSERAIPQLESAKRFANAEDRGRIKDPELTRSIDTLLEKQQATKANVEKDEDKKETVVSGNGDIVAHIIRLEHH